MTDSVGFKIIKGVLVVVIPILFILTFAVLFLKLAGFDVKDEVSRLTSHLPFASHSKSSSDQEKTGTADQSRTIAELRDQIKQLNDDIDSRDKKIESLSSELNDIQKTSEEQTQAATTDAANRKAKTIAQVYQNMDPSKAAAILASMNEDEAASFLNMMNNQTKAKIMEQMPADKAAKITPLLSAPPVTTDSPNSNG
ncbi:MAG: MotE family protein [Tuberibacillus sp.]